MPSNVGERIRPKATGLLRDSDWEPLDGEIRLHLGATPQGQGLSNGRRPPLWQAALDFLVDRQTSVTGAMGAGMGGGGEALVGNCSA